MCLNNHHITPTTSHEESTILDANAHMSHLQHPTYRTVQRSSIIGVLPDPLIDHGPMHFHLMLLSHRRSTSVLERFLAKDNSTSTKVATAFPPQSTARTSILPGASLKQISQGNAWPWHA